MFQSILDNAHSKIDSSPMKWSTSEPIKTSATILTISANLTVQRIQSFSDWGPKRDPLYIVIPITTVYALIFFAGVIGNISTCIVIARNRCMHTATNYYLFSLAISDLLLLISGLPPEIYAIWSKYPYIFGEAFCVLQGFAAETSANATVLTITAFTIERYVAICYPFLSHTMSKLSRAIKFIIGIWIVAMFLAIPQAVSFGIVYEMSSNGKMAHEDHYVCTVKTIIIPHAFEISTLVFFVAPMSMITILYILIGLQLHSSTVRPSRSNSVKLKHRIVAKPSVAYTNNSTQAILVVNGDNDPGRQEEEGRKNFSRNAQATKHVVKMLVAVVVAFFICWAPFHAQRLLAMHGQPTTAKMVTAFNVLTYISGVLYFLSTTINPLLYHIMSHRFREAFKDTFNRFFRRGRRATGPKCYSTLSGRSSQVNSHSNTDSCSRQSSLRYLDTEIARLRNSRRPLVVSFKRRKPPTPKCTKQVFFDIDLQEALDNLRSHPSRAFCESNHNKNGNYFPEYKNDNRKRGCSFLGANSLQSEKCPLSETNSSILLSSSPRIEDIEIFQEQTFKIHKKRSCKNYNDKSITKSCTMPQIVFSTSKSSEGYDNGEPWKRQSVWSCDDDSERSGSCSRLELILENNDRRNDGIIIKVP